MCYEREFISISAPWLLCSEVVRVALCVLGYMHVVPYWVSRACLVTLSSPWLPTVSAAQMAVDMKPI